MLARPAASTWVSPLRSRPAMRTCLQERPGTGKARGEMVVLRAMRKRFRVTVRAVDADGAETEVGSLTVDAKDRGEAQQKVLAQLWTPELAASGKKPTTHAERVTGEGG
jgi:hypothetical protein